MSRRATYTPRPVWARGEAALVSSAPVIPDDFTNHGESTFNINLLILESLLYLEELHEIVMNARAVQVPRLENNVHARDLLIVLKQSCHNDDLLRK